MQQIADFKSGARKSSVPTLGPQTLKASLSKAVTDADMETAAAYFSSIKPRSIVRVVEADIVPKTYITGWHLAVMKGEEREPIGQRIIEVPEDLDQFVNRDTRALIHRIRPTGKHQEGPRFGQYRRERKDCSVCNLSRSKLERPGTRTGDAGRSQVIWSGSFTI